MDNLGFLYAIVAALAWGSYMVPFKRLGSSNPIYYQALMGLGVLLSGFLLTFLMGYSFNLNIAGIGSGFLWAFANIIFLSAITNLGLSKAIPTTSSMVILTSFLWGSFVFGEISSNLLLAVLSIGLIIFGVCLVGSVGISQSQNLKKGFSAAVLAGIIFGSQFTPVQITKVETKDFFFAMAVGVFIATSVIMLVTKTKFEKISKEGLFSGALWNLGNLFGAMAISLIGLAKGLPITQLSVVVGVSWGILYFKEIKSAKNIMQISLGTIVFLLGVGLLSLA